MQFGQVKVVAEVDSDGCEFMGYNSKWGPWVSLSEKTEKVNANWRVLALFCDCKIARK